MPRFVLFDIDGTLIDPEGSGRMALNRALADLTGIAEGFEGIHFAGKTDLQIVKEAMGTHGLGFDGVLLAEFRTLYETHLRQLVSRGLGQVKPGVHTLLQALQIDMGFFLGLLTGNTEEGARIKLEAFSLNEYFPVGAFGSDGEDRNVLLPLAVRRLSDAAGVLVDFTDCVVVGDTPKDVECAKVHGARSIAVATGPYGLPALEDTEADLVLQDLADAPRILAWLKQGPRRAH